MFRVFAVVSTIVLGLVGTAASATVINLGASLDGSNEVPPVVTQGSGTAAMTYDTVTGELTWNIAWQNLSGPATAIHFHGAAPVGVNAAVQETVTFDPNDLFAIGSTNIDAGQAADLLAGLWYINVHTARNPGGEIRGQVEGVPAPAALPVLIFGLSGLLFTRRKDRKFV